MTGVLIDVELGSRQAEKSLAELNKQLAKLVLNSNNASSGINGISSQNLQNLTKSFDQANASVSKFGKESTSAFQKMLAPLRAVKDALFSLPTLITAVVSAFALVQGAKTFYSIADSLTLVQNRLRLVTKSASELNEVQFELYRISRATNSSLTNSADLFYNLSQSLNKAGKSALEFTELTRTVQQGALLSGSGLQAMSNGVRQLNQALASGVLRGDELNSVLENIPRVGKAIADGLGVTIGELRTMAEAGKVTATAITDALGKQASALDKEFSSMTRTAEMGLAAMNAAIQNFVQVVTSITRSNVNAGKMLDLLANKIDEISRQVVPQFYIITQGFSNYIKTIDAFTAAQLTLRGLKRFDISIFDAYGAYKDFESMKGLISKYRDYLGLAKKQEEKLGTFDFKGRAKKIQSDLKSNFSFSFSKEKPDLEFLDILKNAVRLAVAFGHAISGIFSKVGKLLPDIRIPIRTFASDFEVFFKSLRKTATEEAYWVFVPVKNAIEGIYQTLTLFKNGDNELERAFVKLARSSSIKELIDNLNLVGDAGHNVRFNNLDILNNDLKSFTKGAIEDVAQVLRYFGVLENRLLFVNNIRFDRLIESFRTIASVAARVFKDVVYPAVSPFFYKVFLNLKAILIALEEGIVSIFTFSRGEQLAENIVKGAVFAFEAMQRLLKSIFSSNESFKLSVDNESIKRFVDGVKNSFNAIASFLEAFFSTLFKKIVRSLSKDMKGLLASGFSLEIDLGKDIFKNTKTTTNLLDKVYNSIAKREIKYDIAFNTTSFQEAMHLFDLLLLRLITTSYATLGRLEDRLRTFGTNAKKVFFDIYDKVVGHSYWPDTIDEINSYTERLTASSNFIDRFKARVVNGFRKVYEGMLKSGGKLSEVVIDIKLSIQSIPFEEIGENIRRHASAALIGALMFAFGGPALKAISLDFFSSALLNGIESSLYKIPPLLSSFVGEGVGEMAHTITVSMLRLFDNIIGALPDFTNSFLSGLGPIGAGLKTLFHIFGDNGLIYAIIFGTGAYAIKAKKGMETVKELLTGLDKKGKKRFDGVFSHIAALFDIKSNTAGMLSTAILGNNPKLLVAGILAVSSAYLNSISLMSAASVGVPMIVLAMFGKDAGARLIRESLLLAYTHLTTGFSKLSARTQAAASGLMAGVAASFAGVTSLWQTALITGIGAALPAVSGAISGFVSKLLERFKPSEIKSPLLEATKNLGRGFVEVLKGAQENAAAYGDKKINISQFLSKEGPRSKMDDLLGLPDRPTLAQDYGAFKDALANQKIGSKTVSEIKAATAARAVSIGRAVAEAAKNTKIKAAPILADLLISAKDGLEAFKSGFLVPFSKGVMGALALMRDGVKLILEVLTSRLGIFVILTAGFATAANAASSFAASTKSVGDQLKSIVGIVAVLSGALITLGEAFKIRGVYKTTKDTIIDAAVKAASINPDNLAAANKASSAARMATMTAGGDAKDVARNSRIAGERAFEATMNGFKAQAESAASKGAFTAAIKNAFTVLAEDLKVVAGWIGKAFQFAFKGIVAIAVGTLTAIRAAIDPAFWQGLWAKILAALEAIRVAAIATGVSIKKLYGILSSLVLLPVAGAIKAWGGLVATAGLIRGTMAALRLAAGPILTAIGAKLATVAAGVGFLATGVGALVVGTVGALGLWLFGPGDTLADSLEYFKDKIFGLFDSAPTGHVARLDELKRSLAATTVGTVKVDFDKSLSRIDFNKITEKDYALLNKSAAVTKETIDRLKEAEFNQGGKLQKEQQEELIAALRQQQKILDAQPRKIKSTFAEDVQKARADILAVDNSSLGKTIRAAKNVYDALIQPVFNAFTAPAEVFKGAIAEAGDSLSAFADEVAIFAKTMARNAWLLVKNPIDYFRIGPNAIQDRDDERERVKLAKEEARRKAFFSGPEHDIAPLTGIFTLAKLMFTDLAVWRDAVPNELQRKAAGGLPKNFGDPNYKFITGDNNPVLKTKDFLDSLKIADEEIPKFTNLTDASAPFEGFAKFASEEQVEKVTKALNEYRDAEKRYLDKAKGGFFANIGDARKGPQSANHKAYLEELKELKFNADLAADAYARINFEEAQIARKAGLNKEYTLQINELSSLVKAAGGSDIGDFGKDFLANSRQELQVSELAKSYNKTLNDMKKQGYSAESTLEAKIKLKLDTKALTETLEDIQNSTFLENYFEYQIKLSGLDVAKEDLQTLFETGDEGYNKWVDALNEYVKALRTASSLTASASPEEYANARERVRKAKEALTAVKPSSGILGDLNKGFSKLSLQGISAGAAVSFSEESLNRVRDKLNEAIRAKDQFEQQTGKKPFAETLKDLQEMLSAMQQLNAKKYKGLAEALGKAGTQAARQAVLTDMGVQAPTSAVARSTQMGANFETLSLRKQNALQEIDRLSQNRISPENSKAIAAQHAIVNSADYALGKLNEAASRVVLFSNLLSAAGSNVAFEDLATMSNAALASFKGAAGALADIEFHLNNLGSNASLEQIKAIVDRKQKAQDVIFGLQLQNAGSTADKIEQSLAKIGINGPFALKGVSEDVKEKATALERVRMTLERMKLNPKFAGSFNVIQSMISKTIQLGEELGSKVKKTFGESFETANSVFNLDISEADFARLGSSLRDKLSSVASSVKANLESIRNTGAALGETSAEAYFNYLESSQNKLRIVKVLSDVSSAIARISTDSAAIQFAKLSEMLPELGLNKALFSELDRNTRVNLATETANRHALMLASEISDLSPSLEKILLQFADGSKDAGTVRREFEAAALKELDATVFANWKAASVEKPTDLISANNAVAKELESTQKALAELTSAITGKPSASTPGVPKSPNAVFPQGVLPTPQVYADDLGDPFFAKRMAQAFTDSDALGSMLIRGGLTSNAGIAARANAIGLNLTARQFARAPEDIQRQFLERLKTAEAGNYKANRVNALPQDIKDSDTQLTELESFIEVAMPKFVNAGIAAGNDFANALSSNFTTALQGLLSGQKDGNLNAIQTFFKRILSTITSSIINEFTKGLMEPLTGQNDILNMAFKGIGESIFKAGSGLFSGVGSGISSGFSSLLSLFSFAEGGAVAGPGTGTSDSILARLSNGEFVVNAKAASKNMRLLSAINTGTFPKFANGGIVGSPNLPADSVSSNGGNSSGNTSVFNINITGDISNQTRRQVMSMIPEIAAGTNAHNRETNYSYGKR